MQAKCCTPLRASEREREREGKEKCTK